MTDEDKRPAWSCQTPEELARWLAGHTITKITHHWEFTSEDTSKEWIELHANEASMGEKDKWVSRKVASNFLGTDYHSEFKFSPDHARLVQTSDKVRSNIEAIDKWEAKNKRDRAEFDRLKRKFEA
jgi:hypothetical protein